MSALRSSCRRGRGRARCAYVSRVLAALILIAPSLIADRAIAYAAPPTTSAQPVRATFRVLDVVGQSPGLVGRMLGRSTTVPEERGDRAHGVRTRMYSYRKGTIEISFVRGKADWITYRPAALAYNAEVVLDALGLQHAVPTFANEHVLRWEHTQGLLEVLAFPKPGGVNYLYVLARTKP